MNRWMTTALGGLAALLPTLQNIAVGEDVLRPARERFSVADVEEVPDFQRHLLPLLSRVGCNGRACHGSFQGQGGFRLSLFGYDFEADHDALKADGEDRVDVEAPELSLILQKPTLAIPHKGGKVIEDGSWQYAMLARWIEAGAPPVDKQSEFSRLEVLPTEILFDSEGEQVPLRVIAHWADGTSEDVTCLTRFQTNDDSIALVDPDGVVTGVGSGDTHVVAFYDNGVAAIPVIRPVSDRVGPSYPKVAATTEIDRLVVEKLRKLGIVPSETCDDAEFLRRVSLDLTGTLPSPSEVEEFLARDDPDKRTRKIDELLERATYAAWWTNRLCDILGNSPGNFQGQNGAGQYARQWYDWLYRRIADNQPYDEIVADMVLATSRAPGQSYEEYAAEMSSYFRAKNPADITHRETMPYFWARRNFRQPEEKALGFSYAFLGVRLECAQCHKHPFDQWTQQDFRQFQAFFEPIRHGPSRETLEMRRELLDEMGFDPTNRRQNQNQFLRNLYTQRVEREGLPYPWDELIIQPVRGRGRLAARANARVITPRPLGGDEVDSTSLVDPREPLMEWMRDPQNPYFARAIVNRVWANAFGRGIVDPPDDMNLANPPSNGPLLDYLTEGFIANGFDLKWLHREILNSDTYQRTWRPNETNRLDERNFSRAVVRRLPAEVILDAIRQASAGSQALSTVATRVEGRGIGPDGTARYRRGGAGYADGVFGRSARDTNCDCSRSDEPNLLQLIFLQNDPELLAALDRKDGWLAELREAKTSVEPRMPPGPAQQLQRLEFRIDRLEKQGGSDAGELRRLHRRREAIRAMHQGPRGTPVEGSGSSLGAQAEPIRTAYLRTLSREPNEEELAVAREFLNNSEDVVAGVRDLLWALLNTKEFMTNH